MLLLQQASARLVCRTSKFSRRLLGSSVCREALQSFDQHGKFSSEVLASLTEAMPPTQVSITQLSQAARHATPQQSLLNAVFMHSELIARRAVMLQQLQQMPTELANSVGVLELAQKYEHRLSSLLRAPRPRSVDDEEVFASKLRREEPIQLGETRKAFGLSLAAMAQARGDIRLPRSEQVEIDRSIDRFFLSRVGIRFLIKHYLAAREPREGARPHSTISHWRHHGIIAFNLTFELLSLCLRQALWE